MLIVVMMSGIVLSVVPPTDWQIHHHDKNSNGNNGHTIIEQCPSLYSYEKDIKRVSKGVKLTRKGSQHQKASIIEEKRLENGSLMREGTNKKIPSQL